MTWKFYALHFHVITKLEITSMWVTELCIAFISLTNECYERFVFFCEWYGWIKIESEWFEIQLIKVSSIESYILRLVSSRSNRCKKGLGGMYGCIICISCDVWNIKKKLWWWDMRHMDTILTRKCYWCIFWHSEWHRRYCSLSDDMEMLLPLFLGAIIIFSHYRGSRQKICGQVPSFYAKFGLSSQIETLHRNLASNLDAAGSNINSYWPPECCRIPPAVMR